MLNIDRYLTGDVLYGDDFADEQIEEWFDAERDGFADLPWDDAERAEAYQYHALNKFHGFRHLKKSNYRHALGLGSAFGTEFLPIVDKLNAITIVEPSADLRSETLGAIRPTYIAPNPRGTLPFPDATFDLMLVLGVLHHIPNVTDVIKELGRCMVPGGHLLIREPMVSMGDWRYPRPGLTRHERGIPRRLMLNAVADAGFQIQRKAACLNPLSAKAGHILPFLGPSHTFGAVADAGLSSVLQANYRYHPTNSWQKLRPTSLFILAERVQLPVYGTVS